MDEERRVSIPISITNLIEGNVKKPMKGLEDFRNPDGSKPTTEELVRMTKGQINDFASFYFSQGDSETEVREKINKIILDNEGLGDKEIAE